MFVVWLCFCIDYTFQKLKGRISALEKSSLPARQKEKWRNVLVSPLVSSDESDCDDHNRKMFFKKTLPCRSEKVTKFFYALDRALDDKKTEQSTRQTVRRIQLGEESSRPAPDAKDLNMPTWAFTPKEE